MDDGNITFRIDPGGASAQEIADVMIAMSELHRAAGGSGFRFEQIGDEPGHMRAIPLKAEGAAHATGEVVKSVARMTWRVNLTLLLDKHFGPTSPEL